MVVPNVKKGSTYTKKMSYLSKLSMTWMELNM